MSGIIGRKIGMTSVFDADGKAVACTVIQAEPNVVTNVRTTDRDGYHAFTVGAFDAKDKHLTKADKGRFSKAGVSPKRHEKEFKFEGEFNIGDTIDVNMFEVGDFVYVIGTSKGKGFQGVVKRHGFSGVGGQTHGQHNRSRHPGSIGACSFPSRVFKGLRMAGRTGSDQVTIENLRVLQIIPEHNLIVVSGSIPGAKNSIVYVEK